MRKFFMFATLISLAFASCTKDPADPVPPVVQDPADSTDTLPPADTTESLVVYIAGDSFDRSTSYHPYPIYWKNGVQLHLPHPGLSSGNAIAVSGNDVYVTSSGEYYGNNVTYWKNGTPVNLSGSLIYPATRSITIVNADVYTLTIGNNDEFQNTTVYWKNQAQYTIAPGSESDARSIAVTGDNIYIAGSTIPPGGYGASPACYWINGTPVFLHAHETGLAKAILVNAGDVHIAGDIYLPGAGVQLGTAMYWKNEVPLALTGHDSLSYANALALDGDDVYIAGAVAGPDYQFHAAYWKNGSLTVLDHSYSFANGIAVFEGDVYVVGNRSVDKAILWKNGATTELGRGRANAIVVKRAVP